MASYNELRDILIPRQQQQQHAPSQGSSSAPVQPASPLAAEASGVTASSYIPSAARGVTSGSASQTSASPVADLGQSVGQSVGSVISGITPDAPFKTGLSAPTWPPPAMTSSPMDDFAPKPSATVPPEWKRFDTAQKMQTAVRNNWSPNPTLIRLLASRHGA